MPRGHLYHRANFAKGHFRPRHSMIRSSLPVAVAGYGDGDCASVSPGFRALSVGRRIDAVRKDRRMARALVVGGGYQWRGMLVRNSARGRAAWRVGCAGAWCAPPLTGDRSGWRLLRICHGHCACRGAGRMSSANRAPPHFPGDVESGRAREVGHGGPLPLVAARCFGSD